jgi:hypothetical protein
MAGPQQGAQLIHLFWFFSNDYYGVQLGRLRVGPEKLRPTQAWEIHSIKLLAERCDPEGLLQPARFPVSKTPYFSGIFPGTGQIVRLIGYANMTPL